VGAGLGGIPLDSFSVTFTPGAPTTLVSADSARWTLRGLEPGDGFAGAVVSEGKGWATHLFDLDVSRDAQGPQKPI